MTVGDKPLSEKAKQCPTCKREYPSSATTCSEDGTILVSAGAAMLGVLIAGKYEILSQVGHGGMSIVYKAKHQMMDRLVAIKMLQLRLVNDPVSLKRFQQEAQVASSLTHPNLIAIYDFGILDSTKQPYIVMSYLIGESLADIIKRDGFIPEKRVLPIFMQACDALAHAHKRGVLHRDLKASNIMLITIEEQKDVVQVVDFGIAKFLPSSGKQSANLTQTGEIFGSPIYMSPEQCLGQPLDTCSDIYSIGVVMYEALTGFPPLLGNTIIDTMKMHVSTKPPRFKEMRPDIQVSKELETVVFKALEKNPTDRYQTMSAFYEALRSVAISLGISVPEKRHQEITDDSTEPEMTQNIKNFFLSLFKKK